MTFINTTFGSTFYFTFHDKIKIFILPANNNYLYKFIKLLRCDVTEIDVSGFHILI